MSTMLGARRPALLLGAAAILGACAADQQTVLGPVPAPSASLVGVVDAVTSTLTTATVLKRGATLPEEVASQVIGPKGGVLWLPKAGLRVVVPAGAVSAPTPFSVRSLAGDVVAYEFQPHGTRFAVPLRLEQDVPKAVSSYLTDARVKLELAYFADPSQVDAANGTAQVDEFLPLTVDVSKKKLSMNVWHFSGYMMSTGRKK